MENVIGVMEMPQDFKYRDVFLKGRPQHDRLDRFSIKHPKMPPGKRAKIFAPFDALRGFNEAVSSKETVYTPRRELSREAEQTLNHRLNVLHELTRTRRLARQNQVVVSVTYFVPCADERNFAFGLCGQYQTLTGICSSVDPDLTRTLCVGEEVISFSDIWSVEIHISCLSGPM